MLMATVIRPMGTAATIGLTIARMPTARMLAIRWRGESLFIAPAGADDSS